MAYDVTEERLKVRGSEQITRDLKVNRDAFINGDLDTKNIKIEDDLSVGGEAVFADDVAVHGDLYVTGTTTTTSEAQVSSSGNYIVTRDNNNSPMGIGQYSGLAVNNYATGKIATITSDNEGTWRISDSATSTATTFTNISAYNGVYYSGLTQTTTTGPSGILTDVDADELSSVVLNGTDYYHHSGNDWFGPITLVNNSLNSGSVVTDATLIATLDSLTKNDLVYYRSVISKSIDASTNQPLLTRDESSNLTNNHALKWDSTNEKAVDSGVSITTASNITSVTADNFVGHLTGNADTATNATNAVNATNAIHATTADSATNATNATNAVTATTAAHVDAITGFTRTDAATWGSQIGTVVAGGSDGEGGDYVWRKNNPSSGQLSLVLDGTVYVDEGAKEVATKNDVSAVTAQIPTDNTQLTNGAGYLTVNDTINNAVTAQQVVANAQNVIQYKATSKNGYRIQDSQTNALYVEGREADSGDTGGIAITNDAVSVFGAGDTDGVLRVINEDNVDAGPVFKVMKDGQTYATGRMHGTVDNADTVDGYHASEAAYGSTVAARNSSGYLNAAIFHDDWTTENINSYSSPTVMFKGNGDGYLRSTSIADLKTALNIGTGFEVLTFNNVAGHPGSMLVPTSSIVSKAVYLMTARCKCHIPEGGNTYEYNYYSVNVLMFPNGIQQLFVNELAHNENLHIQMSGDDISMAWGIFEGYILESSATFIRIS